MQQKSSCYVRKIPPDQYKSHAVPRFFHCLPAGMSAAVRQSMRLGTTATLTLAGGVHALAFATDPLPAWSLPIVQVLALSMLVRAAHNASCSWQAFVRGWWFGLVNFGVGLYWLFISMNHYGGLPTLLAVAGVLTLSAFLALSTGMACGLFVRLRPATEVRAPWVLALIWSGAWTSSEWLRSVMFTGFPWLNIGYAHVDSPLAGWAPLLGVHGIALLAAFAAAAVAALTFSATAWPRSTAFTVVLGLALVIVGWLLMRIDWSSATGRPLNMRLVQGNIEQLRKFDPALLEQSILRHLQLAAKPPSPGEPMPDLIVLPETVLPMFQDQLEAHVWEAWRDVAKSQHSTIALGVPLRTVEPDGEQRYTNSAIGFDAHTPVEQLLTGTVRHRYDKHHLVPWGEYVPPGFEWFVQMLNMPLSEFDHGPARQPPFMVGGQPLALNICYENVFGSELLPSIGSDPGASILVNLSNLGWFGDTWALRQHLQIGRMRSIETARPMVTSTNTGITAHIDSHGRILAALPPHQAGVLPVTVQGMTGLTPYTRFGDAPVLLLSGALLIIAAWGRGKYGPSSETGIRHSRRAEISPL